MLKLQHIMNRRMSMKSVFRNVQKRDKALCDAINKAIHELFLMDSEKLARQYFGEDFASNVSLYK